MEDNIVKNVINHFKLKAIKERIITYLGNLFELEEGYCKLVKVGNFYSKNYIQYKSNGDRNKTLSVEDDTWKI